jgi:hypothetical protein
LVEALCYKPEGHGLIPNEVTEFFNNDADKKKEKSYLATVKLSGQKINL